MYRATVFIISKRKELSAKYKKIIEGLNQDVFVLDQLSDIFGELPKREPELILISDTINEDLGDLCSKIRVLTFNFRPTIVAISKSSDINDKLKILEAGADDFLSEPIPNEEFQARIKAHLRRSFENFLNPVTFFVRENLTLKTLKRTLRSQRESAILLLHIYGLSEYQEIYGEIACEKVLQTFGAIVNSTLKPDDFIGEISQNEFALIVDSKKTESLASFLTFAFDNVLERFYNESDFQNKFVILSDDEKTESKIPLMKLCISAVEISKDRFSNYKELLNLLRALLDVQKTDKKSSYLIDRIKIQGESANLPSGKILLLENDDALSYLIETTCEIKGYDILVSKNKEEFLKIYNDTKPEILIVDYGSEENQEGLEICKTIRTDLKGSPKIIFSSSIHNKKEILSSGADLYLPKPYEINTLFEWIEKYMNL